MKRKFWIAFIGIFTLAAVVAMVEARPGKRGSHWRGKGMGNHLQELSLTDEQTSKIKTLRLNHQKTMIQLRADAQTAQLDLRELMHQDNPNASAVKAKVNALNSARAKMTENRVQFRMDLRKTLTSEQRKKLDSMHPERMGHRRPDSPPGFGFRGGPGGFHRGR